MEPEKIDCSENKPDTISTVETCSAINLADCDDINVAEISQLESDREDDAMDTDDIDLSDDPPRTPGEQIDFKVIFNKNKHDIIFEWDRTIRELKEHLETIIGVAQSAQKLMIKGMAKDEMTLRTAGIVKGSKVMIVGSKMNDILAVTNFRQQHAVEEKSVGSTSTKEPFCEQKIHRKILDKGVPPDAMPGLKGAKEPLPPVPLSGMINKHGGKVRLTFKLELDQVWIGTKERTEKLALTSIKAITSETIKGHEEYHIMALQLGPTEASRYWVYWVPAQYVDAIKEAILDKWQFF